MAKTSTTIGLQAAVLLGLFCLAYWVPLQGTVNVWLTNDDYSYGFFIPAISAYLIWERRKGLRQIPAAASWSVLPVFILVIAVSLYAILGSSGNISRPLLPIAILTLTAFCFGLRFARYLLLPLAFLIFMVPVPGVIERSLGMFLKRVASEFGGQIIRLFDIPVYVSGNIIDLGTNQLQVVDACSGMRYLFPLLAFGILYGYLFESRQWKRLVIALSTIPVAVLTNALRVGITGVLTNKIGPEVAEGFMHDFSGWVIFWISCALVAFLGRLLKGGSSAAAAGESVAADPNAQNVAALSVGYKAFTVACIGLAAVALFTLSTHAMPAVKLNSGIANYPLEFVGWQGRAELIDAETVDLSGAEQAFSANYKGADGGAVSLYIGYRGTAFLDNENFFHSPTVCLPSGGWKILQTSVRRIEGVPRWGSLSVTEMLVEQSGQTMLVNFWFQTKDKATHDKNLNRFHLSQHALLRSNTYDLFIREITHLEHGEDIETGRERLDLYTRDMMVTLFAFLDKELGDAGVGKAGMEGEKPGGGVFAKFGF